MSHHKITEANRFSNVITPQDVDGIVTGAYVDMGLYRRAAAVAVASGLLDTKILTVQFFEAQDAAGTGAQALGDVATFTSSEAPSEAAQVTQEVVVDQMTDGFDHLTAQVTCDQGVAISGSVQLISGDARYKPAA